MSQININPELLNKIDKIFSRALNKVSSLDKSFIHYFNAQIDEVGFEIAHLERELSFIKTELANLESQKTSLKNKEADIQMQILSINPNEYRDADERSFKLSQISDLQHQIAIIRNDISYIESNIATTRYKEALCTSNLENQKMHYRLLTQKRNTLIQNSNTISLKTSDLLEKVTKKVANIKNSIDDYSSIRVSDSLGQSGTSNTTNSVATTTTPDTLSFVKHHYESFSIDVLANRAKVTLLTAEESFEIKKRDKTLVVLNKSKTLVQTIPQEYFEAIECIAKENALQKVVAWVEESIEIYKKYGYTHKSTPTAAGVEMLKEYIL